mgnify:CR=1 FL=1
MGNEFFLSQSRQDLSGSLYIPRQPTIKAPQIRKIVKIVKVADKEIGLLGKVGLR